jgi:hypothetical protein
MKKSSTKTRKVSSGAVPIVQKKNNSTETFEQKLERLKLLEQRERLKKNLPHLCGFDLYQWQIDYIESTNRKNFICAGNQLGKSVCNILKAVRWATSPDLWPKLWKKTPIQFWYLLPTKDMVTKEFRTKWVPEILPRGEFKNDPIYGWREEIRNKHLWAIHFNSGVSIYFHTYEQDVHHLQGATVDAIFVDEEVPWELMPELQARIQARDGYFNAVMTPTRGQEMWRRVFEEIGSNKEVFPDAKKLKVSLFDCRFFASGLPSHWTEEKINSWINSLGTQGEIDLRVHGKFTVSEGLKIPAFRREVNLVAPTPWPTDWYWYSGVDIGGGGQGSLPAICFIAVRPDFRFARITQVWRGVPEQIYEARDIFQKYVEMKNMRPMLGEVYDYGAKDFGTIATRAGFSFVPANKDRKRGFGIFNTLLKNGMLIIDDTPENQDLVMEITTLREETTKKLAYDDAVDAARYCLMEIPFAYDHITGEKVIIPVKKTLTQEDYRRGMSDEEESNLWSNEEDFLLMNDLIDGSWE